MSNKVKPTSIDGGPLLLAVICGALIGMFTVAAVVDHTQRLKKADTNIQTLESVSKDLDNINADMQKRIKENQEFIKSTQK